MSRGAGSRAISHEEKRLQKEKEKRIREANRMLIPVPKSTVSSMHLISFDPTGTFHFEDNSWKRVYWIPDFQDEALGTIANSLQSSICFTQILGADGRAKTFMTLTLTGETYDEVRTLFSEDEMKIPKSITPLLLSVNDVMDTVAGGDAWFSYASMVRGKKDWKKECMAEITDQPGSFRKGEEFGECLFVMQYPKELKSDVLGKLREIGCNMSLSFNLNGISTADQIDFGRALEQKFNKHGMNRTEFINASLVIMFTCDSDDARAIIEKTILSILSAEGFVVAPCIGAQKEAAEAAISLGLLSRSYVRNIRIDLADRIKLWGGQEDGSD